MVSNESLPVPLICFPNNDHSQLISRVTRRNGGDVDYLNLIKNCFSYLFIFISIGKPIMNT